MKKLLKINLFSFIRSRKNTYKAVSTELRTINHNESNTGPGNGLTVDSLDNLFKHGMKINLDRLNYTPLKFSVKCFAKSDFK